MIECPDCGSDIDVDEDELDPGESILCEECGRNYTVSSVDPLELEEDEEPADDEDFDEEFDEEEEDEEGEEEEEEEEEEDEWR